MHTSDIGTLLRLSETDETVANPDKDIRDRDVIDKEGNALGTVKDLLIDDTEREVRFLEIASGGFLGIGQDRTFIPVDAITSITENEVRIDPTRKQVADAPAYDPELIRERENYGPLLGYYGYAPFWTPGYIYPDYPYYGIAGPHRLNE